MIALALLGCASSECSCFFTSRIDNFAQPSRDADVLLVVSEAPSMAGPRERWIAALDDFLVPLEDSGTTWQLGVLSATAGGGLLGDPPVLRPGDDLRAILPARIPAGVSEEEEGLTAALEAASHEELRREAVLLVAIVSTNDDGGSEPVDRIVGDLHDLRTSREDVVVGSVVGGPTSACAEQEGLRYEAAAAITAGPISDVCAPALSEAAGTLGRLATGIRTRFRLSHAAVEGTLEVSVDDVPLDEGWSYDPDAWTIAFAAEAVPPIGALISVRYEIDPGVLEPSYE